MIEIKRLRGWHRSNTVSPSPLHILAMLILCSCAATPLKYTAKAVASQYVEDISRKHTQPLEKQLDLVVTLAEEGLQRAREADRRVDVIANNVHDGFKEVAAHHRRVLTAIKEIKKRIKENQKSIQLIGGKTSKDKTRI